MNSDAVVALHLTEGIILIAGTAYAGEMKKAVFTAMNYYLPLEGILSLHSSANVDPKHRHDRDFLRPFGDRARPRSAPTRSASLSATTSMAGPTRASSTSKVAATPRSFASPKRPSRTFSRRRTIFGTILENVVFDEDTRQVDLDDDSVTENTRGSYPLDLAPERLHGQVAPHPSHVILLTADAFGVMPPLARLTSSQALYHFLSGYTSKLAGH